MATNNLVRTSLPGWCGLVALAGAFLCTLHDHQPSYIQACILIGSLFAVLFGVEAALCIRGSFGLIGAPCQRGFEGRRALLKIGGWAITILCVSSAYWIVPMYRSDFYSPYFQALSVSWPYMVCFFLFCILWEDLHGPDEYDDYYRLACALLNFKIDLLRKVRLKQHFLGWVVKLYFLPLMFASLIAYIDYFKYTRFFGPYDSVYNTIFLVDTAFACAGYLFANTLVDTQLRSTDPTLLGWACTLICYQPFWSMVAGHISYGSSWGIWLGAYPQVRGIWFSLIVLCWLLYVWATISFGSRFSNLTHRGILTCGPYAYMRHPAYIGKVASLFLINVPFVAGDFMTAVRYCAVWGLLAGVYYLRAKTEEVHLRSLGPEYDLYTKQVDQNWKKLFRRYRNGTLGKINGTP